MRPTIRSIAEYAGVSRGTVDRVIHNRPKVDPEKRRRVEEALRKFDYRPNPAARSLALKSRDMKVAMLMPPWPCFHLDEVRRGVDAAGKVAADFGFEVLFHSCATNAPEEYVEAIDELLRQGARGLAICSRDTAPVRRRLRTLTRRDFPVVTFNSDLPKSGRLCFVGQDEYKSGRIAGDLMARILPPGGKVAVVVANLQYHAFKSRLKGFSERFAELGRDVRHNLVLESENEREITYRRVLECLESDRSVTGLYLASESITGAMDAVRKVRGEGRLRIVTHDLPSYTVEYLREGVIDFTVDQNLYQQGFGPVTMLVNYLVAGKRPEAEAEYTEMRIVCAETA